MLPRVVMMIMVLVGFPWTNNALSLHERRNMIYNWTTSTSNIVNANDKVSYPIYLRGLSWFGFETPDFVVNGLWSHPMTFYLDTLHDHGFNALRVPFSAEWILYNKDIHPTNDMIRQDLSVSGMTSLEILDRLFSECEKRGITILLDLHRLHKEYISELWYSATDRFFPSEAFFDVWFTILDRYIEAPNLLGIDVLNEPHGAATWGGGNPSTDWRLFVEYAIPRIASRYPQRRFLFFVEGIEWGHLFPAYTTFPLRIHEPLLQQIVFSPHVYGHSVVPDTSSDPTLLFSQWTQNFGYLVDTTRQPVIPGEWGGRTDLDTEWMKTLGTYVQSHSITSNFFWSLGPNSGDVQGLLYDDWTTLDPFKISIVETMVSTPTLFTFS